MSVETLDVRRLAATELFSEARSEDIQRLLDAAEVRLLHPGEILFRAGESYRHALLIVYAGTLVWPTDARDSARSDVEMQGGEAGTGTVLGLSGFIDHAPYATTVRARGECTVLVLDENTLARLEHSSPALFESFNRLIAARLRQQPQRAISGALATPVHQYMKAPLASCAAGLSLNEAFQRMQTRKIGSLGVVNSQGELLGLLTCSSLSAALIRDGVSADTAVLAACVTPQTIDADAPLWQAEEILHRHGCKYLVVTQDDGLPCGMLSQTDILRALVRQAPDVLARIGQARTSAELRQIFEGLAEVARGLRETNRLASRSVRLLSDVHLAIQRRCVALTLGQLREEGLGEAPRDYAVLVMGSGGRREMLLNPDQDNGLIIADAPAPLTPAQQHWFERFAGELNRWLDEAGYRLCPGEIMARNPQFHKTLAQWCAQIRHLSEHPNQKAARWSNIVFDFDTLWGDERLTRALRRETLAALQGRTTLLEFMVEDDAAGRPPLGWFNRLVPAGDSERPGHIDLKRNGLRIIADAARVYALSAGIETCNTQERLQALLRQGRLSAGLFESVSAAQEILLDMLLEHQIQQCEAGQDVDKLLPFDTLGDTERASLRMAMLAVKRLQDQLQGQFGREAF